MSLWINDGLHKAEDGIRSFLLVGQSNMAGRGDLSKENALTAPDCFMPVSYTHLTLPTTPYV